MCKYKTVDALPDSSWPLDEEGKNPPRSKVYACITGGPLYFGNNLDLECLKNAFCNRFYGPIQLGERMRPPVDCQR